MKATAITVLGRETEFEVDENDTDAVLAKVKEHLGSVTLDTCRVSFPPGSETICRMFVDDNGFAKRLSVNAKASRAYGRPNSIVGPVVIFHGELP